MHQPLDPRYTNICLDSNALQPPNSAHDALVQRFLVLWEEMKIIVFIPEAVRVEALRPNVPAWVRERMASALFTIQTSLTADEVRLRQIIEQVLRGNAQPGKHADDAAHVFNAAKHGSYFITHDERVLERAKQAPLPPSIQFMTMAEFMKTYDYFIALAP